MAGNQQSLTPMGPVLRERVEAVSIDTVVDYVRRVISEARAVRCSSGVRNAVSLPGLSIGTVSFDPAITEAIGRNFIQAPAADPAFSRMQTFIVHPGVEGVSSPLPWDVRKPCHPQRIADVLREAGLDASYFSDLDHWHLYDRTTATAVQLMRDVGHYPPWETGAPLRPFLHWHYAQAGRRLTHCGTLGIGGKGIILAGAGGSGKSGTVIAGLLHGLQSIGDDYVLLEAGSDVSAYPLFATLKQDPAGFERLRLSERLGNDLPLNWQGKHQFTIEEFSTDPVPSRLSIGALLLPHIGGSGRTEITQVSRAEAMIALAASSIYQMPGERESGFRFFGEITRRLPCFRVTLGSDPAEVAGSIGEFIQAGAV